MGVSIILPLYKQNKILVKKIKAALKKQKYDGKKELIFIDGERGLASSLNEGIKRAKYTFLVSLHQDCVPSSTTWLTELLSPLKKKEVVASVSDVELPLDLWNTFSPSVKVLTAKEQRILTPLLDEKGCAYKKSALMRVGLFDEINYRTAGEDFDIAIKLRQEGVIAYPHTKVIHHHAYTLCSRLHKEYQLANGFGALVRIYRSRMPGWHKGLLKALPVLGLAPLFLHVPFRRTKLKSIHALYLYPIVHILYIFGFWKGYLKGQQTV
jgi:GT2 family glycosyltransferase